jgi:hypothetical protein
LQVLWRHSVVTLKWESGAFRHMMWNKSAAAPATVGECGVIITPLGLKEPGKAMTQDFPDSQARRPAWNDT